MNFTLSSCVALFVLCVANAAAQAADNEGELTQGVGAAFVFSKDSENFYTQRLALEYLPKYTHADLSTRVRYTNHHYAQNAWARSGTQISFLHQKVDPITTNGWKLDAGMFRQGPHDLLTVDTSYRSSLSKHTSVDMFLKRDWVETAAALDNGVHFAFGGVAIDQVLSTKVTLVGLAGLQSFSDDNSRNHGRIKLIYQPDPDLGLTLQMRYRAYTSSSDNVGNAYFNPSRYDETMLAVGWRQRVMGWLASLTAGSGQQKVATNPITPTYLLELALQTPAYNKHYSFRARAMANQSASYNGPGYRYNILQGEWIVGF